LQGVQLIPHLIFKLYVMMLQSYNPAVAGVLEAESQNLNLLSKLAYFYEYQSLPKGGTNR
jgi:hypothetical protein